MSIPEESASALQIAAEAAQSKSGKDIVALNVGPQLGITDAFLFVSAESERQVLAIKDEIEDELREKLDIQPLRREGMTEGRWVLLDYGHIIVHIQHQEERELYALDRLWAEAESIALDLEEGNE